MRIRILIASILRIVLVEQGACGWGLSSSHRDGNGQANDNAGKHSIGGLAIVSGGEEARVLKGAVSYVLYDKPR